MRIELDSHESDTSHRVIFSNISLPNDQIPLSAIKKSNTPSLDKWVRWGGSSEQKFNVERIYNEFLHGDSNRLQIFKTKEGKRFGVIKGMISEIGDSRPMGINNNQIITQRPLLVLITNLRYMNYLRAVTQTDLEIDPKTLKLFIHEKLDIPNTISKGIRFVYRKWLKETLKDVEKVNKSEKEMGELFGRAKMPTFISPDHREWALQAIADDLVSRL